MSTTISSKPEQTVVHGAPATIKSRVIHFYRRYEKYTGLAIFGIGFIWDSLTMTRVDSIIDNVILLFYLIVIAAIIIITLREQCGRIPAAWIQKLGPKLLWAMQFCFGGLFSSYVIFYFKSASFSRTQFFFLILVILWIGNEFLEERLKNQSLLAILYCFCLFSFLAFFLPVVTATISAAIFCLAGFISLFVSLGVFAIGFLPDKSEWRRRMLPVSLWIGATFLTVNLLYFANLIPPVPLALKQAHIYHQVVKTSAGYEVTYVAPSIFKFWRKWDSPFYHSEGESVYCYTAVFAPGGVLHFPVFHVWSRKMPSGWVQTDRIRFDIKKGGREGGYRGYTKKNVGIVPGNWRVEVETERGQTLGRIDFTVSDSPSVHPPMKTDLIR